MRFFAINLVKMLDGPTSTPALLTQFIAKNRINSGVLRNQTLPPEPIPQRLNPQSAFFFLRLLRQAHPGNVAVRDNLRFYDAPGTQHCLPHHFYRLCKLYHP